MATRKRAVVVGIAAKTTDLKAGDWFVITEGKLYGNFAAPMEAAQRAAIAKGPENYGLFAIQTGLASFDLELHVAQRDGDTIDNTDGTLEPLDVTILRTEIEEYETDE